MTQQLSIAAHILINPIVKTRMVLAFAWHAVIDYQATKYRPEKYYMRGPRPTAVR